MYFTLHIIPSLDVTICSLQDRLYWPPPIPTSIHFLPLIYIGNIHSSRVAITACKESKPIHRHFQARCINIPSCLGLPQGLLPFGSTQNNLTGRHLCLNHFNWKPASFTPGCFGVPKLLILSPRLNKVPSKETNFVAIYSICPLFLSVITHSLGPHMRIEIQSKCTNRALPSGLLYRYLAQKCLNVLSPTVHSQVDILYFSDVLRSTKQTF